MRRFPEGAKVPLRLRGEIPRGLEGVLWLSLGSSAHCAVHLKTRTPYCVVHPGPLDSAAQAPLHLHGMPSRLLTAAHEVRVRRARDGGVEVGVRKQRDPGEGSWTLRDNVLGLINAFDDVSGALAIDLAQRSQMHRDGVSVLRWGVSKDGVLVGGRPLLEVLLRHVCAEPHEQGSASSVLYGLERGNDVAGLVKHSLVSGRVVRRAPDFGQLFGFPVVAAGSRHAGGKHSWLLVCVRDALRDQVELSILSTADLHVPSVASLRLPPAVRWDQPAVWNNSHDDDSWLTEQTSAPSDA